jgi:hypothetical protein
MLSILQLAIPDALVDDDRFGRLVDRWRGQDLVAAEAGGHALTPTGRLWYNHMQLDLLPAAEKLQLLRMVGDLDDLRSIFTVPIEDLNPYELELRDTLLTRGRSRPVRSLLFKAYFGVRRLPGFDNRAIGFTGRPH